MHERPTDSLVFSRAKIVGIPIRGRLQGLCLRAAGAIACGPIYDTLSRTYSPLRNLE